MQTAELVRVVTFVTLIVVIYVHSLAIVVGLILRRRKPRPDRLWLDRITLILALIGAGCMVYGRFVEPYRLSITHVTISSSKIPLAMRPIRVAHLSDIHSDATPRLEIELPEAVRQQKPDLIVMSGDYFNSIGGMQVFKTCLAALTRIAPTYVVKGNWETDHYPEMRPFDGTGAHELDGTAVRLEIEGVPIWVAGLAAHNEASLGRALIPSPSHDFRILIHHFPDFIQEAADHGVDLYVAGHTHGGQVALPFYGALVTLSKFGKRYEAGLFRERDTWMYVNRGLGVDGGFLPKVRFWVPPELTIIDIEPAD